MDQRCAGPGGRRRPRHGARLAEAHAAAANVADRELAAHERVQVDAPRDEVAAGARRLRAAGRTTRRPRPRSGSARCRADPRGRCLRPWCDGRPRAPCRAAPGLGELTGGSSRLRCDEDPGDGSAPRPALGSGGRARATSSAATTKPAGQPVAVRGHPEGSQTTPEGTPNITTARGSPPPSGRANPIQGPAQLKPSGSATGARPRPRPPSQRVVRHPAAPRPHRDRYVAEVELEDRREARRERAAERWLRLGPTGPPAPAQSSSGWSPRWRRKRWKSRARVSPEGMS